MGRKAKLSVCLAVSIVIFSTAKAARAGIIYVDADANGANTGASWIDAFVRLQDALAVAWSGDEIRVASGVYTDVNALGGLSQVVYINDKSVAIRGGFTTTNWTDYDPAANITEIDAQGNGRAIYISGPYTVTIEGLTITGGNANGLGGAISGQDAGGGLYMVTGTAIVTDCLIVHNTASNSGYGFGGGLHLLNSTSSQLVNSR